MSDLWAVIPAAGQGLRSGQLEPKQFFEVARRSLLDWSVDALFNAVPLQGCVIAVSPDRLAAARSAQNLSYVERLTYCVGGSTRAESVAAGLRALKASPGDWVLVHDAARPCVPAEDIQRLVTRVRDGEVGGVLAQPVAETLKRADDRARVEKTVDRSRFWRAQTPQMFRLEELRQALERALSDGYPITDEASAMERAGYPVQLVEGSVANLKVTYPEDFSLAEFWLRKQGRIGLGAERAAVHVEASRSEA